MYSAAMTLSLPLPDRQLGIALRRWRILNCVKQQAAGTLLGVSQATISRWESGGQLPDDPESSRIMQLLSSRQDLKNDRALVRLVEGSSTPVHLMCDFSHRLFAASPARSAQWRVDSGELVGRALWRFATEGIARAEVGLGASGWHEPHPPDVIVETERADFAEVTIPAGALRYARIPLSDGAFARLVWDEPPPCP